MADEKVFTIPLGRAFEEQRTRRAKTAIQMIKDYLTRHTKAEKLMIGASVNKTVWARGIQKPPRKVRVHVKIENNVAYAEVLDVEIKTPSTADVKKKEDKKVEKDKKIKDDRKERRKMSIQEEMKKDEGKAEASSTENKGITMKDDMRVNS